MPSALGLARPATEPDRFVVHPWLRHRTTPDDLELLRGACRLAWHSRELHVSLCSELRPESGEAYAEAEVQQWNREEGPAGPWDGDGVRGGQAQFVQAYSAVACNNLAAAATCTWNGEYLFTLPPLIRAATEAVTTGAWLLTNDPSVSPRYRAARLFMLLLSDAYRGIDAAQTSELRAGLKGVRDQVTNDIRAMFNPDEILEADGRITAIAEQAHPSFDRRFELFGDAIGEPKVLRRYYMNLSQLAHPNPLSLQMFQDEIGYRLEPEDLHAFLRVGVHLHALYFRYLGGYFGWPDEYFADWIDLVAAEFPGTFVD